uniref:Leucine-rich repeat and death domain-containing protein 1 n=1 Tax=Eptatretus burgeri TaxID=7764 RepID=A0A8C4QHW7_EPTBU
MFLFHVHDPGCFNKLFSGANEAAASYLYTAKTKIMCQKNVLHPWNKIVVHTAKEAGADDVLDLSQCDLHKIPAVSFSLCNVLQKKVLLLHTNRLSSFTDSGDLKNLSGLQVLDLHFNKLMTLPKDIGQLTSLQVLNLENNKLQSLPESIGELHNLRTLNVKDNALVDLPDSLKFLSQLYGLDLRGNHLNRLPKCLAYLSSLQKLDFDLEKVIFPPMEISSIGTDAVRQFLCKEAGIEFLQTSHSSEAPAFVESVSKDMDQLNRRVQEEAEWEEDRKREQLRLEQSLQEQRDQQTQLALDSVQQRETLVHAVRQETQLLQDEVQEQQQRQNAERQRLVHELAVAEIAASDLVHRILDNELKFKHKKEMLEAVEKKKWEEERLVSISQEEVERLRRQDVAQAMQEMLHESSSNELLRQAYEHSQVAMVSRAMQGLQSEDTELQVAMSSHLEFQAQAVADILQKEEVQKKAFEALQLQKDTWHSKLREQIMLVERQLIQLSKLEMERKETNAELAQNVLIGERLALSELLQRLLKDKERREEVLQEALLEMDRQRVAENMDFWLVQYQRLLDSKPLSLKLQESTQEDALQELLIHLGLSELAPVLARHNITLCSLATLLPQQLGAIGIYKKDVQISLIDGAVKHIKEAGFDNQDHPESPVMTLTPPASKISPPPSSHKMPTAPPEDNLDPHATTAIIPSAPLETDISSTMLSRSECVVCLDRETELVFLPCGHVCCCMQCAGSLCICPLCRREVQNTIRLYRSQ